jgi:hypothetical protein
MRRLALLVAIAVASVSGVPAASLANSNKPARVYTWQHFQAFFLNATGIGLIRDAAASSQQADYDLLRTKDQTQQNGPIYLTLIERFGEAQFYVYRPGHAPSACWKRWQDASRLSGRMGPINWTRTPLLDGSVTPPKFDHWLYQVGILYGNVCVDTSVDRRLSLPATWFRLNAVMSKLR